MLSYLAQLLIWWLFPPILPRQADHSHPHRLESGPESQWPHRRIRPLQASVEIWAETEGRLKGIHME